MTPAMRSPLCTPIRNCRFSPKSAAELAAVSHIASAISAIAAAWSGRGCGKGRPPRRRLGDERGEVDKVGEQDRCLGDAVRDNRLALPQALDDRARQDV